jgi:hypothetical protein
MATCRRYERSALHGTPATDRTRLLQSQQRRGLVPRMVKVFGQRVEGHPGGSVRGNGIRTHDGSLRVGCRGRPDHRSTKKPRLHRDIRKPRVRLPHPDCPNRPRIREPWSTLRQWSSSTIRDMNQIRGRNPMSPRHRELHTTESHPSRRATRPGFNPPQHHTHVQHSCRCIHVDT